MTDWQIGLQAFREGRMREAVDRLGEAVSEEEMTVSQAARFETCAYFGAALYAEGFPADAVSAFETAFRLSPTPIPPDELTLNLAHAYLAARRREAAREALLFLLAHSPGHVAGRMLLQRLGNAPEGPHVTGSIMGDSVESARRYLQTVNFTRVPGGYDPAEVKEVLALMEQYLTQLDRRLQISADTLTQYEEEIQRYRQMEEAMVQNIVQMQQNAQNLQQNAPNRPQEAENSTLSPIEMLFQNKT